MKGDSQRNHGKISSGILGTRYNLGQLTVQALIDLAKERSTRDDAVKVLQRIASGKSDDAATAAQALKEMKK